jgi:hypothetical protein
MGRLSAGIGGWFIAGGNPPVRTPAALCLSGWMAEGIDGPEIHDEEEGDPDCKNDAQDSKEEGMRSQLFGGARVCGLFFGVAAQDFTS